MTAGGIPVVRGSTASVDELAFILQNGRCQAMMIQEPEALARLLPALKQSQVRSVGLRALPQQSQVGGAPQAEPGVRRWPRLLPSSRA
eukprot:scaffold49106_cov14-Tisochrysis_lutea.AAC.1